MLSDLVLIHRMGPQSSADDRGSVSGEWTLWRTCLRQIYLGFRPSREEIDFPVRQDDEVFYAADAYRFLIEVLCGLHSRVLGENEIVSQFKKRFFEEELSPEFSQSFRKIAQSLLSDMKQVRRKHPLNLGAHSYGSFCRKETEGEARVTLIGTGELSLSILPWLTKKSEVQIAYRSVKGRNLFSKKLEAGSTQPSNLFFSALSTPNLDLSGALVVAAPISARHVEAMIGRASRRPSRLVDLRGEAEKDPILPLELEEGGDIPIVDLQDFFREMEASNRAASAVRVAALKCAADLAEARLDAESILIRTQGWEDLVG